MKALKSKIKLLVVILVVGVFVWTFILSPMLTFKANEKRLEDAARRYYELNSNLLPTGERVGTVSLNTLYKKSYIEKDLFIPLTKKTCSVTNSWVKVKRENGEYKYYTYLECGLMTSSIDHKGPEVKLNGDTNITLGVGDDYTDPGIKSVIDNKDGKMNVKDVKVTGKVNTSSVGTFEIKYSASDSLNNKTTVVRTVEVVQKLNSLVKKNTGDKDYYIGGTPNNYVYFSNMLFRIVGLEGNNVKIVADKDIANVNYDGIDEWFKYYESNLTDNAKKYIKNSKYCNMKVTKENYKTTKCTSYGKKTKFGLLSIDEINRVSVDTKNYLVDNDTIGWTANSFDNKSALAYRMFFAGANQEDDFMAFEKKYNFGVRPVMVIDGSMLVSDGDGSIKKPYVLEDYIKPVSKVNVNERYIGEYISYSGMLWRITSIESDGSVRVISESTLLNNDSNYEIDYASSKKIYNPKQKGNVGYIINNRASEFFDTKYAVQHEIEVPIYKDVPNYGKEIDTKKYTVKVSAPNMYEMFSATSDDIMIKSYWLVNSSKNVNIKNAVSDIGVVMFEPGAIAYEYGIRPVIYLNKNCTISSGKGIKQNPFIITK